MDPAAAETGASTPSVVADRAGAGAPSAATPVTPPNELSGALPFQSSRNSPSKPTPPRDRRDSRGKSRAARVRRSVSADASLRLVHLWNVRSRLFLGQIRFDIAAFCFFFEGVRVDNHRAAAGLLRAGASRSARAGMWCPGNRGS